MMASLPYTPTIVRLTPYNVRSQDSLILSASGTLAASAIVVALLDANSPPLFSVDSGVTVYVSCTIAEVNSASMNWLPVADGVRISGAVAAIAFSGTGNYEVMVRDNIV
jgi:hypothetical protein